MKEYLIAALLGIGGASYAAGVQTERVLMTSSAKTSISTKANADIRLFSEKEELSDYFIIRDPDGIRNLVFEGARIENGKVYKIDTQELEQITGAQEARIEGSTFRSGNYTLKIYAKDMKGDKTSAIVHFGVDSAGTISMKRK